MLNFLYNAAGLIQYSIYLYIYPSIFGSITRLVVSLSFSIECSVGCNVLDRLSEDIAGENRISHCLFKFTCIRTVYCFDQ